MADETTNTATEATTKRKAAKKATKKAVKKSTKAVKKATKKAAKSGERLKIDNDAKIFIADRERVEAMHKGSRRSESLAKIKDGVTTVAKYVEKGGDRMDLYIMFKLGIVRFGK